MVLKTKCYKTGLFNGSYYRIILGDFCKKFNESLEKALIADQKSRLKKSALSLSEAMTIVILFHQSGFRFFKYFYCQMIAPFWKSIFPQLPSYNRLIEIMPRCLQRIDEFLQSSQRKRDWNIV